MKIIHHHFESLDSTNAWAKEHASTFVTGKLTLVSAHHQTGGKGRLGRPWVSPAGKNIYATFCFFMDPSRHDIGNLSQVMAIAAAEVVERKSFTPKLKPKLKWPNDLLLGNKKFCGILTETKSINALLFIAIGIGMNVNMLQDEVATIDRPATSLLIESGREYKVEELIKELSENFVDQLQRFIIDGFAPFLSLYNKRLAHTSGCEMSFRDSQRTWQGRFSGINSDGSLAMLLENGELKTFVAGELMSFGPENCLH